MKPDLSIVILNYNSKDYLDRCVKSVKNSDLKKIKTEIIIVDNASTDGSAQLLKKFGKGFKVIENRENYGFSKGNNTAVTSAKGKYVLFLNPDTFVSKNALKEIYEYMEKNTDVGVSCPRLNLPNGTLTTASHRGFPTPWNSFAYFSGLERLFPKSKLFAGYTMGWLLDDKKPHEVDSISGGFFFVRTKAAVEVGWWDEDYFLYGEDLDFCYRLKEKGWKVMFLPQISVLHYHGVSSGIKSHSAGLTTADKKTKKRALKASTEAMKIFYKKHYLDKYPGFLNMAVLLGIDGLNIIRKARGTI